MVTQRGDARNRPNTSLTHPRMWIHVSQLPESIQISLKIAYEPYFRESERLENVIGLISADSVMAQALQKVIREQQARACVPALFTALGEMRISARKRFRAIGLFLGLHHRHVQRLFYGGQRVPGKG